MARPDCQSSDRGRAVPIATLKLPFSARRCRTDAGRCRRISAIFVSRLPEQRQWCDLDHRAVRAPEPMPPSAISANVSPRWACRAIASWSARAAGRRRWTCRDRLYRLRRACRELRQRLVERLGRHCRQPRPRQFRLRGPAQHGRDGRRSARFGRAAADGCGGCGTRRATVCGHYEKGEVTQADKRTSDKSAEQSG